MLPADIFEVKGKFYKGIKEGPICEGCVFKEQPSTDCNEIPCDKYARMEESSFVPITLHIDTNYNWLLVRGTTITACNNKPKRFKYKGRYISYRIAPYSANVQLVKSFLNLSLKDITDYGTLYKILRNKKKEVIGFECQNKK